MLPRQEPINVLVCTSISDPQLELIASAGSGTRVTDAAALVLREVPDALRPGQQPPNRSPVGDLDTLLADTEIILSARRLLPDLIKRAPRLRWVQLPFAGVDWVTKSDLWKASKVHITSAAGISAQPIAEYILMMMLAHAKDLRRVLESQASAKWDRINMGQLRGKTLGILGFGAIGKEIARLAQALGMVVLATKRTLRSNSGLPDWVFPIDQMPRVLAESDYVLLSVPATPETVGMIGPKELAAMKPGGVLINISRGDVVYEGALIEALQGAHLGGAALDVFQVEPLPQDSPLWQMPNVVISSHIAGLFEDYDGAVVELFAANLVRYLDGEPLLNLVDRRAGY